MLVFQSFKNKKYDVWNALVGKQKVYKYVLIAVDY